MTSNLLIWNQVKHNPYARTSPEVPVASSCRKIACNPKNDDDNDNNVQVKTIVTLWGQHVIYVRDRDSFEFSKEFLWLWIVTKVWRSTPKSLLNVTLFAFTFNQWWSLYHCQMFCFFSYKLVVSFPLFLVSLFTTRIISNWGSINMESSKIEINGWISISTIETQEETPSSYRALKNQLQNWHDFISTIYTKQKNFLKLSWRIFLSIFYKYVPSHELPPSTQPHPKSGQRSQIRILTSATSEWFVVRVIAFLSSIRVVSLIYPNRVAIEMVSDNYTVGFQVGGTTTSYHHKQDQLFISGVFGPPRLWDSFHQILQLVKFLMMHQYVCHLIRSDQACCRCHLFFHKSKS